jgi:hypothetical protein
MSIELLESKFSDDDFLYSLVVPFIMFSKLDEMKKQNNQDDKFNKVLATHLPKAMHTNKDVLFYLLDSNSKESGNKKENESIKKLLNEMLSKTSNGSGIMDFVNNNIVYIIIAIMVACAYYFKDKLTKLL